MNSRPLKAGTISLCMAQKAKGLLWQRAADKDKLVRFRGKRLPKRRSLQRTIAFLMEISKLNHFAQLESHRLVLRQSDAEKKRKQFLGKSHLRLRGFGKAYHKSPDRDGSKRIEKYFWLKQQKAEFFSSLDFNLKQTNQAYFQYTLQSSMQNTWLCW